MRLLLSILLLSTFAHAAYAQEQPANPPIKDYQTLSKLLLSYGINPVEVNWGVIEPLCLPLQTVHSNFDYNQCRFDKAIDVVTYRDDSATCNDEARARYPQALLSGPRAIITQQNSTGETLTTINTPRLTRDDLDASRRATFDSCMTDKGWRNGRNWRLGQAR